MPRKPAKPNKDYKGKKAKYCSTRTLQNGKTIVICNNSKNAKTQAANSRNPPRPPNKKFSRKKITKGYSSYPGRFKTGGRIKKPGAGGARIAGSKNLTKKQKIDKLVEKGYDRDAVSRLLVAEINKLLSTRRRVSDLNTFFK